MEFSDFQKIQKKEKQNTANYILLEKEIEQNGWHAACYLPKKGIISPMQPILLMVLLMWAGCVLFSAVVIMRFSGNMAHRLERLKMTMAEVDEGNLEVELVSTERDEIGDLTRGFNQMLSRIRQLIQEVYESRIRQKQYEMTALRAQINPHFLYNSHSFIVTAAVIPNAVTEMAVHLSQDYRYCTRKKSITTIQEEIDYARSYLEIMAMRKNIEYEIESDPELAACKISPQFLQPIIENAIEHAIEEREIAKHIYVKVYQKVKDEICFEISDDGNGLTEEQIAALKERLARKNRDEKEGVGLWNVNQRLVNYYGEQSSLQFGGSIWKGLCVFFVIDGKERL